MATAVPAAPAKTATANCESRGLRGSLNGIVGLETSVSLTITELVDKGWITPMQMAEKMSYNPAQILHLTNKGSLKPGKDADVVVIDPKESYVIDVKDFVSKGKNTPFQGKKVNGKVKVTICGGRVVYEDK